MEEESSRAFNAKFEKDLQDILKSTPPRSNQIEPSATPRQEEYEALRSDEIHQAKRNNSSSMVNSVVEKAESENTLDKSIQSKDASFSEQVHGNTSKTAMLDFSGREGAYMLPYDFCAKEADVHQEKDDMTEQCSVNDEHQIDKAQDLEIEIEALENQQEVEQSIVPIVQPLYLPNVFKEVCLADSLLVFQFGQNYIVDASISKIFINFERPIDMSNLFVNNNIVTNHFGQHITPFIEADGDNLS
jgi:hypothetical protein